MPPCPPQTHTHTHIASWLCSSLQTFLTLIDSDSLFPVSPMPFKTSAISLELTPQLFATFLWHLLWTFNLQAEEEDSVLMVSWHDPFLVHWSKYSTFESSGPSDWLSYPVSAAWSHWECFYTLLGGIASPEKDCRLAVNTSVPIYTPEWWEPL